MSAPYVPHATYQEFRDAVIGHGYDIDGYFGYQCWDGVDLLYEQSDIGQYLYTGNRWGGSGVAKECWTYPQARALNGSGHFTAFTGSVNIKRGDILVLNTYSGWYGSAGHIAFADEDYNGTEYINMLGQNQGPNANPTTGVPFNIRNNFLGTAFLGGFRYDRWESTPPTPIQTEHRFPWVLYARKFRSR